MRHLERDLGLSVYGQHRDLKTGQAFQGGCMDYSYSKVMRLRVLTHRGKLTDYEGNPE